MRTRERIAALAITLTVLGSLAMLGSGPRWASCAALFLAVACALPQLFSRRTGAYRSPLVWLLGIAALCTAVQLIPLPAALVQWLAPARHGLEVDNARALGLTPQSFLPLTFDTAATWLELAKLAGYLLFAYACLHLARSSQGRDWLARTVAGAGIAMAACALLHHLLGLRILFAIYEPAASAPSFLAPLLNDNHLAGFLALTTPLIIALAMAGHGVRRVLWAMGALLCAAVSLLVQSRGAAVALAVGLALMAGASLWHRHLEARGRVRGRPALELGRVLPIGVVLACVVVLLATFAAGGVRDELATTSAAELQAGDSKLGVWRASADLARDNTWTGVGRGAFEYAFTRVHHSGLKTYSHVENQYLQTLVDWGLPVAAILALLCLWTGLAALRHWRRSPLELGALCGLTILLVHSAVGFCPGAAGHGAHGDRTGHHSAR